VSAKWQADRLRLRIRLRLRLRPRPRSRTRPRTARTARTANLCNNFKTEIALAPAPHTHTTVHPHTYRPIHQRVCVCVYVCVYVCGCAWARFPFGTYFNITLNFIRFVRLCSRFAAWILGPWSLSTSPFAVLIRLAWQLFWHTRRTL